MGGVVSALQSILAATDFSEEAGHATARAALIAHGQPAALELIHVISEPSLSAVKSLLTASAGIEECLVADAGEALRTAAARIFQAHGLKAAVRVCVGDVVQEILAAGSRADLIAVGGHGANPLRDLILGSTAERLLGRRTTPVLVIKRAPAQPYKRVLLAVDFSGSAAAALDFAMRLAPQAEFTLLHAYNVPFESKLSMAGVPKVEIERYRRDAEHRAREQIESLILAGAKGRTGIVPSVARGDAPFLILNKQEALNADLIVLGCRRQSAMAAFLLGSVSRHVLADAQCDVLVLPGQAAA